MFFAMIVKYIKLESDILFFFQQDQRDLTNLGLI